MQIQYKAFGNELYVLGHVPMTLVMRRIVLDLVSRGDVQELYRVRKLCVQTQMPQGWYGIGRTAIGWPAKSTGPYGQGNMCSHDTLPRQSYIPRKRRVVVRMLVVPVVPHHTTTT